MVEHITGATANFYYQDGLGNTSHVSDASGNLLEFYKYTAFGLPTVYAPDGSPRKNGSSIDVRHLFTGQLWMPKSALYDYRNRVYSPTLTALLFSQRRLSRCEASDRDTEGTATDVIQPEAMAELHTFWFAAVFAANTELDFRPSLAAQLARDFH